MKTFWSLFGKLLIVIVVIQAWFLYDYYNKNQQLTAENIQLEGELLKVTDELLAVKDELSGAKDKIAKTEKRSVEHIMKETNKAVVQGWEKLMDAVSGELDKARETIHELSEPKASSSPEPEPKAAPPESTRVPPAVTESTKAETSLDLPITAGQIPEVLDLKETKPDVTVPSLPKEELLKEELPKEELPKVIESEIEGERT